MPGRAWKVDFVARSTHYIDHLAPIYLALPPDDRGCFFTRGSLVAYAARRGVQARPYRTRRRLVRLLARGAGPVVTTGYKDLRIARRSRRPQVLNNHGAGFTYSNGHPSYAGAKRGRRGVVLLLSPSRSVVEVEQRASPRIAAVAIGCPKLDEWHARPPPVRHDPPVVALSFHFNGRVAPETRSALRHYRAALPELAARFALLGHGHPRVHARLRRMYARFGIPFEPDFSAILERADLYVCDNSSTLYEFASIGKPVVLLNAPWYRRHVDHPGNARFWKHADVGLQCDRPQDLIATIERALADPEEVRAARERACRAVYEVIDGSAASRAARAILNLRSPPA